MSFSLNSVFSALKGTGLTGTALTSAVQAVIGNSPAAAVKAACAVIVANSGNPEVVKDEATKIAEIANVPAGVTALLPAMTVGGATAEQVIQVALQIEQLVS
jgi:RecA/RadA recombinase